MSLTSDIKDIEDALEGGLGQLFLLNGALTTKTANDLCANLYKLLESKLSENIALKEQVRLLSLEVEGLRNQNEILTDSLIAKEKLC